MTKINKSIPVYYRSYIDLSRSSFGQIRDIGPPTTTGGPDFESVRIPSIFSKSDRDRIFFE